MCRLAYNYFTFDFQEAAHGRAPAMATGIKRVRPDLIVFTYQGDGDLASIGRRRLSMPPTAAKSLRPFL
jgi:pyruvate/2-oxoacid:ferredoxin oxidoreductase beta subunit